MRGRSNVLISSEGQHKASSGQELAKDPPLPPVSQELASHKFRSNNRERGERELIGRFSEQSHLMDYILTRGRERNIQ